MSENPLTNYLAYPGGDRSLLVAALGGLGLLRSDASQDFSDEDQSVIRSNIGAASLEQGSLAETALQPGDVGTEPGTVAAGDDARINGAMQKSQNLADLADKGTAQDNIQVGAIFADVSTAQGATIAARNKRLRTQFYATANRIGGANYRRESLANLGSYPALSYFRSTDRFMPDESTDDTNGGYWVLDEADVFAEMLGAVLDGVVDCTAAINAAVELQGIRGGGVVRLGAGTVLLSNSSPGAASWDNYRAIFIGRDDISLIGSGRSATRLLLANGANAHVIQIGQRVTSILVCHNVRVAHLEIDGNRIGQTPPTENENHWSGVYAASSCTGIWIEDNDIHDCQYYGVGMQRADIVNSHVDRNRIWNVGGDGIDWKDDNDNTYGNTCDDNQVWNFGLENALLTGQSGIDLRSGVSARNNDVAIGTGPKSECGIRLQNGSPAAVPRQPSSVDGFTVRGTNVAGTVGLRVITRYGRVQNGYVKAVDTGCSLSDPDNRFSSLFSESCGVGFRLWQNTASGGEADTAAMFGLIARTCTVAGIVYDSVDEITVMGADVRNNAIGHDVKVGSTNVRIIGGSCSGNTTQVADAGTGTIIKDVSGFRTSNRIVQAGVDIAATGIKTITFTHGLAVTPNVSDATLQLVRETNVGDWTMGFLWITGVTATQITAQMRVVTASATAGAVVSVALSVDAKAA